MTHGGELFEAVANDDRARVAALIARGVDLDARNGEGRTALHDAIEDGRSEIQELLLAAGAEVDAAAAAILGRVDRLRELLDADPTLANDDRTGISALAWAAYGDRPECAALLIERGARMDDGELFCAASCGHVAVARTLLDHGADPNATWPGHRDGTPLHVAARMPYTCDVSGFACLLLERGADPNLRDADGETPLTLARARDGVGPESKRYDLLLRVLREHGAVDPRA